MHNYGWEETDDAVEAVIHLGTSARNHIFNIININAKENLLTGVAKVAFAAHRDSLSAVSLLDSGASKSMFKDR